MKNMSHLKNRCVYISENKQNTLRGVKKNGGVIYGGNEDTQVIGLRK